MIFTRFHDFRDPRRKLSNKMFKVYFRSNIQVNVNEALVETFYRDFYTLYIERQIVVFH